MRTQSIHRAAQAETEYWALRTHAELRSMLTWVGQERMSFDGLTDEVRRVLDAARRLSSEVECNGSGTGSALLGQCVLSTGQPAPAIADVHEPSRPMPTTVQPVVLTGSDAHTIRCSIVVCISVRHHVIVLSRCDS